MIRSAKIGTEGLCPRAANSIRSLAESVRRHGSMWRIILLSVIPGFILIIQNGIYLHRRTQFSKSVPVSMQRPIAAPLAIPLVFSVYTVGRSFNIHFTSVTLRLLLWISLLVATPVCPPNDSSVHNVRVLKKHPKMDICASGKRVVFKTFVTSVSSAWSEESDRLALLQSRFTMKSSVQYSLELGRVIHQLQQETGEVALYISSLHDPSLRLRLNTAFRDTDKAIGQLSMWTLTRQSLPWTKNTTDKRFESKTFFQENLHAFRERLENITSLEEVVKHYTSGSDVLVTWMIGAVQQEMASSIWSEMVAFHMLINGKSYLGLERDIGAYFFSQGMLNSHQRLWYKGSYDLAKEFGRKFRGYSARANDMYLAVVDADLEAQVEVLRKQVIRNYTEDFSTDVALVWMDNMTAYIDLFDTLVFQMASFIEQETVTEIVEFQVDVVVDVIILVMTFLVATVVSYIIFRISRYIQNVKDMLQEKTVHLQKEQRRTESLLSQLVPAKIARRMRTTLAEPEMFPHVTVMYTDLCNFDSLLQKKSPSQLLTLMNDVFEIYERRIVKYNVTKVGCTGHVLMAASGLTKLQGARHAVEVARLALDLVQRISQIKIGSGHIDDIQLKVGVSTGSVIGGVINAGLPRYCLFGETVGEAKHMLDTCPPLQIHLTAASYLELSSCKYLVFKEHEDSTAVGAASSTTKTYILCGNLNESLLHFDLDSEPGHSTA
ncbi:ANPRB-like protein [Mya arenaria]|uniref:ANPRB-like protein n=1 Tax=Mya arenaria TaxID=6604 RepID=A0ABY7FCQ6_MYAAR|nr:ANPRB-like protein [Mya arenaria]